MPESPERDLAVLVVEDEFLIAIDMCEAIAAAGHEALGPARSVDAALKLIDARLPDAALLDENLGGTSVEPVAQELMARAVPFAIVSGHARSPYDSQVLQEARRLPKPLTQDQLLNVLSTFAVGD